MTLYKKSLLYNTNIYSIKTVTNTQALDDCSNRVYLCILLCSNRLSLDDLDMGQESSGFGSTPLHSPTGTNPEQSKGIFNQEVDNMM